MTPCPFPGSPPTAPRTNPTRYSITCKFGKRSVKVGYVEEHDRLFAAGTDAEVSVPASLVPHVVSVYLGGNAPDSIIIEGV